MTTATDERAHGAPAEPTTGPLTGAATEATAVPAPRSGRETCRDMLIERLRTDPRSVLLDSDTGLYDAASIPADVRERYVNVGIAEQNMVGMAAGLARDGFRPWLHTFATFATTRAVEAVKLDLAYPQLPVRIVATHSGLSAGHLGPTHHGLEDVGILRMLPSTTVLVPADAGQTADLVDQAAEVEGPVYLRLGRKATPELTAGTPTRLGRIQTVRDGGDVVLFACGPHALAAALDAAGELAGDGVGARVVNVHTVKPLDEPAVADALAGAGLAVTVEEHWRTGGLGSTVAEVAADAGSGPVLRIGVADGFVSFSGSESSLLESQGVEGAAVAAATRDRLDRATRTVPSGKRDRR